MKTLIISTALLLSLKTALAANVSSSNPDFKAFDLSSDTEFIFSPEQRETAKFLRPFYQKLTKLYQNEFQWSLDEETSIVLAGDGDQVANGFATVDPFVLSTFYYGGGASVDHFSDTSWPLSLMIHELAHLYQLNHKRGLGKLIDQVFGNHSFIFPFFPIFAFPSPNQFLPSWILEGNAVMNESRFGNGGRLFNGEHRALVYELAKAKKLTPSFLVNDHLKFPYGREKYLVGGYFQAYLAKRFGVKKTNEFFKSHAWRFFNPLRVDLSFKNNFKVSYYKLIKDFKKDILTKALKQKTINERPLLKSLRHSGLHQIGDDIYFSVFDNMAQDPEIFKVEFSTSKIRSMGSFNLPGGRVFWNTKTERPLVSGSRREDFREQLFGLWASNGHMKPGTSGQNTVALQGNTRLYYSLKDSQIRPVLFKNQQKLGLCNSQAAIGPNGKAFCFRQIKRVRVLMIDGAPSTLRFQGHFSKALGIQGEYFYFLANTPHGSGLFRAGLKNLNQTESVGGYDTVIDARVSSDMKKVFFVTVTSKGYSYFMKNFNDLKIKKQRPSIFSYSFENPSLAKLTDDALRKPLKGKMQEKSYGAFSGMRFSSWGPSELSYSTEEKFIAGAVFNFQDALGRHLIRLFLGHESRFKENEIDLAYQNTVWNFMWGVSARYIKRSRHIVRTQSEFFYRPEEEQEFIARFNWPWAALGDWTFALNGEVETDLSVGNEDFIRLGHSIEFAQDAPLSAFANRFFRFDLNIERREDKRLRHLAFAGISWNLGAETFLTGEGAFLKSEYRFDEILSESLILPSENRGFFSGRNDLEVYRAAIGLKKVLYTSLYPSVFPLGIRRIAPEVFTGLYDYGPDHYTEYGASLYLELLVGHRGVLPLTLSLIKNEIFGDSYRLRFQQTF